MSCSPTNPLLFQAVAWACSSDNGGPEINMQQISPNRDAFAPLAPTQTTRRPVPDLGMDMDKKDIYQSEKEPPPYPEKEKRRIRKWFKKRKVRILKTSCYATQILACALIVLAWASEGKDWEYLDIDGFRIGGRGYCDG